MSVIDNSKLLAEYLDWKYFPFIEGQTFKSGWYKTYPLNEPLIMPKTGLIKLSESLMGRYVCRLHSQLRFYNSYDELFTVMQKLEKEDLSEHFDEDNFEGIGVNRFEGEFKWDIYVKLKYDPPKIIGFSEIKGYTEKEQLFYSLVAAVKYINIFKNDK